MPASGGLVVRVLPTGAKASYAAGRVGKGRSAPKRFIRIGDCSQVGLAEARDRARRLIADMRVDRTLPRRRWVRRL